MEQMEGRGRLAEAGNVAGEGWLVWSGREYQVPGAEVSLILTLWSEDRLWQGGGNWSSIVLAPDREGGGQAGKQPGPWGGEGVARRG